MASDNNGREGGGIVGGLHVGQAVLHLASMYSRPLQVVEETVQNAIDAGAKHIRIEVRKDQILCIDDGKGETEEGIIARVQRIAHPKKTDQIGHKGIGNLAGLSIGWRVSITTRPAPSYNSGRKAKRYFTVILDREGLEEMEDELILGGGRETPDFKPQSKFGFKVDFHVSTVYRAEGVSKPAMRQLQDLAAIARHLEGKFAPHILEKKIQICVSNGAKEVEVKPTVFPGDPIVTKYVTEYGEVEFEMYVSPKVSRQLGVSVLHGKTADSIYSLPIAPFLDLGPAIREVMTSGYVHGMIRVPFCTLTADRDEFVLDEELEAFWEVLDEWAKTIGQQLLNEIHQDRRDLRIAKVLLNALGKVEKLLKGDPDLAKLFKGLVTAGHARSNGKPETEEARSKPYAPRNPKEDVEEKESPGKQKERKGLTHSSLRNAGGSRRRVVGKQSGIQVDYRVPGPEESRNWRVKREGEIFVFNAVHPDWQAVEGDEGAHTSYVLHLLLKEVSLVEAGDLVPDHEAFDFAFEEYYLSRLIQTFLS